MPRGVEIHKWPHQAPPDRNTVATEMRRFGFKVYDLQTVPGWFHRARHRHDEAEIRGAVDGVITFHFDDGPVTIEAGDILIIRRGIAHEVRSHNPRPFTAFKGSETGFRNVAELGDGTGSVESLRSTRVIDADTTWDPDHET